MRLGFAALLPLVPVLPVAGVAATAGDPAGPALRQILAAMGCSFSIADEAGVTVEIMHRYAALHGWSEARLQEDQFVLLDRLDVAFDKLMEAGELVVDRHAMTATLTDCTPAE